MQEPSPQVKSIEGHGAKPTGCHRQKDKDSPYQRSRLAFWLFSRRVFRRIFVLKFEINTIFCRNRSYKFKKYLFNFEKQDYVIMRITIFYTAD